MNAAKKIILLLWLLIVASLGNVSASTPGATENRTWEKSLATTETRLVEPLQTLGGHQENGGAGYDYAVDCLLAAEGEVGAGQTLYRGVWDDHPAFQEALEGSADPRGGSATALEHNMGDTRSIYTSWTTDPALAAERAGPGGVVLQQTFPAFRLVTSPDLFGEGEVLVTGPVRGASVTPIP